MFVRVLWKYSAGPRIHSSMLTVLLGRRHGKISLGKEKEDPCRPFPGVPNAPNTGNPIQTFSIRTQLEKQELMLMSPPPPPPRQNVVYVCFHFNGRLPRRKWRKGAAVIKASALHLCSVERVYQMQYLTIPLPLSYWMDLKQNFCHKNLFKFLLLPAKWESL